MNQAKLYDVLRAPHYSEKSTLVMEKNNIFVFKVDKKATKADIRTAVESIFKVAVISVNTLNVKGKTRRTRHGLGRLRNWKKAYIRLAEGNSIDLGGTV